MFAVHKKTSAFEYSEAGSLPTALTSREGNAGLASLWAAKQPGSLSWGFLACLRSECIPHATEGDNTTGMSKLHSLPAPAPRISQRVRDAVHYRVHEGLSLVAAAEKAGLSRNGFAKALKRPAVQDLLRQVQEAFVLETEASRSVYKARALEVALDLMMNAKSETVRARMVEFLAGDGKTPQVAVHVDARQSGGYEYLPKGARLVEIESQGPAGEPAKGS